MLFSIVITARDEDPAVLAATLENLQRTTRHLTTEIIVVDDGSRTPVTLEGSRVRLLRHAEPLGVCPSRRAGALLANGEILVWLDAHMSFGDHWLEQLSVQADANALVCSAFWAYDLSDCLCWGADFVWNGERDYAANKYPGFGLRHRTSAPAEAAVEVPMIIGACYAMRRTAYERLGGFSPLFRVWGIDEQDMSARAWMAGMRVICAVHAKVGHLSRAAFPYPVQFEHLEFNQAVMARTLFSEVTLKKLDRHFQPQPTRVAEWLGETDLKPWRKHVQWRRKFSDEWFFARFVPELAPPLKQRAGTGRSVKVRQHRAGQL